MWGAPAPKPCGLDSLLLIALLLFACSQDAPLPWVGDCAEYPKGVYDYGQIGIGSCLSGPTDLRFTDTEDGEPVLLVANSNPYQNFRGGSLLAIPWSSVDLGIEKNLVHELDAGSVNLPSFAGGFDMQGELGIIASRLSEDARVRQHWDDVWLVDLSDPLNPTLSTRGQGGGATVRVQSDPNDVVVDATSGYAFVANRTTHSLSILDTSEDEVQVVKPWPKHVLTGASFDDADGSGSTAEFGTLGVIDAEWLVDERWSLDWIDGTWRLWVPAADGLFRQTSVGDGVWRESAIGVELPGDPLTELKDPSYDVFGRMYFMTDGVLQSASVSDAVGLWSRDRLSLLTPTGGTWDADGISGPGALRTADGVFLFYAGQRGDTVGIGMAFSPDGIAFTKEDDPVLTVGDGIVSGERVDQPFPIVDPATGETTIFYSHFDGVTWSVWRARSDDLVTWTVDESPVLAVDGEDIAAPAITAVDGDWRMWFSRRGADGQWRLGAARSDDGRRWDDLGVIQDLDPELALAEDVPRVAIQGLPELRFRVEGENVGSLYDPVFAGTAFGAAEYGWSATVLAGYLLTAGDAGPESDGGIRVGSVDPDEGMAWLGMRSAGGVWRIGVATLEDDGTLTPDQGAVLEGTGGFDRDGVSNPVVVKVGDVFHMYYAGHRGRKVSIGLATSDDGVSWTRQGRILNAGSDWDRAGVEPASAQVLADGRVRLWFAGNDGDLWRVGSAISASGESFTKESASSRGYVFPPGRPGDWDDSGVRHPMVISGTDDAGVAGDHIWYSGFDGDLWRVGYAFRPAGDELFDRWEDPIDGTPEPVAGAEGTPFALGGIEGPVFYDDGQGGYLGFIAGTEGAVSRVGALSAGDAPRVHKGYSLPTPGDALTFSTERGDPRALAIPLDTRVENLPVTFEGLTALSVDHERGFLYAASKLRSYFYVIDIRDDSAGDFKDLNYLDVEAVIPVNNASGGFGFRQIMAVPGTQRLYALHHDPESIFVMDISNLEDNAYGEFLYDTTQGWLTAPRGVARDQGADTLTDVGPSAMTVHPDGQRIFIANFNANSLTVYDLTLGTHGQLVRELDNIGENPSALLLTPDGRHALVANYAGQVDSSGHTNASIAVIDIDRDSPSYLEVLTWITNQ